MISIRRLDKDMINKCGDDLGSYSPEEQAVYVSGKLDVLLVLLRDSGCYNIKELRRLLPKIGLIQFIIVMHELGHYAEGHRKEYFNEANFNLLEGTASSYAYRCVKKEHWKKVRVILDRLLTPAIGKKDTFERLTTAELLADRPIKIHIERKKKCRKVA